MNRLDRYRKIREWSGPICGAMVTLVTPASLIAWIWSGDYRPLLTAIVVTIVVGLADSSVQDEVKKLAKAGPAK